MRFAWWGAEEEGLLGSQNYVHRLFDAEIKKIGVYLNFDMIGSPNYVRFVYDGDGSGTPERRARTVRRDIEDVFLDYFDEKGLETEKKELEGRSDRDCSPG